MKIDILTKWFKDWAWQSSTEIDAIICFGSHGRGDATLSSDVDLCIVGNASLDQLKNSIKAEKVVFSTELCYVREDRHKLFAAVNIRKSSGIIRIDCFVVDRIDKVERYILGSEMGIDRMNEIFIYKHPVRVVSCESWVRSKIGNIIPTNSSITETVGNLIKDFIESFEVASNKRATGDKFQFLFQLQLAYTALVKLEYIRQGGRKFLYLPKMAFVAFDRSSHTSEDGLPMRRNFEDILEPRGKLNEGHALQTKYIQQFRSTLAGLSTELCVNVLEGIADSVEGLSKTLIDILDRDRFYNFRDAAAGVGMKDNMVFRTGFFEVVEICRQYNIGTVIDLRNDDEVRKRPTNLPADIASIQVDIIAQSSTGVVALQSTAPPSRWLPWHSEESRSSIGLVLRTLLIAPLPVLIHCVAGRDRTGVVCAALQLICGASREDIVRDYCRSTDGAYAEHIEHFIGDAPSDPFRFAMSCGLSVADVRALRHLFCISPPSIDDNDEIFTYDFKVGTPAVHCRPFSERELQLMKYHMLSRVVVQTEQRPLAIIISGLPAAGKSSICKHVLGKILPMHAHECVHIDMDIARTFHGQYMNYTREQGSGARSFQSYEGLVPWLMEGTNLEWELYSHPDGVVQSLLRNRFNFVLATVMDTEGTLKFLQDCVFKHHYRPYLIGVHVTTDTALARASHRGRISGRFTPASIILGRDKAVKSVFAKTSSFVASEGGSVFLFDNDDHGRSVEPKEVFSLRDGVAAKVRNVSLALEYGCDGNNLTSPANMNAIAWKMPSASASASSSSSFSTRPTSSDDRDRDRAMYSDFGYCVLASCLDAESIRKMGADFEEFITVFASVNKLSREEYLSVINKWSHWNWKVAEIMESIASSLRHRVASVLGCDVAWPVGAVIFRKSSLQGNQPTHLHQDIAYARFPGSQLFRAISWIPLVQINADTLAFRRGSHKVGIQSMTDILSLSESTPSTTSIAEEDVVNINLGDALLFDARTLHRSTSFPAGSGESLRLAIGIQWSTAGGLDGLQNPGSYYRFPSKDVPAFVDVEGMRKRKEFGMDTAGWFLKRALVKVDDADNKSFEGDDFSQLSTEKVSGYSTLRLAEAYSRDDIDTISIDKLRQAGCNDIGKAQLALKKYVLMRRAAQQLFGEAQGPAIFESIREWVVEPILRLA